MFSLLLTTFVQKKGLWSPTYICGSRPASFDEKRVHFVIITLLDEFLHFFICSAKPLWCSNLFCHANFEGGKHAKRICPRKSLNNVLGFSKKGQVHPSHTLDLPLSLVYQLYIKPWSSHITLSYDNNCNSQGFVGTGSTGSGIFTLWSNDGIHQ